MKGGAGVEQLEAVVAGTIFRNADNGYSVLAVKKGRGELTVIGSLPELSEGETVVFTGDWVQHPQYGKQFKAVGCELQMPTKARDIEKYLAGAGITGIGAKTAREIVETFGDDTITILTEHPERLQEVPRMGKKRWMMIADSFREKQQGRAGILYLQQFGVSVPMATRVVRAYGDRLQEKVQENPYCLCDDIEGIGFLTADQIAMRMGIARDSSFRIRAALDYVLRDACAGSGHVYLPRQELLKKTAMLLRLEESLAEREISALVLQGKLTQWQYEGEEEIRVYLPVFDRAEKEAARRLCELRAAARLRDMPDAEKKIHRFERENGISFSPRQREAIRLALNTGVLVITGGPGTGKTTIINCIIRLLEEDNRVLLCAPTGRAAKRMTETTGREAKTLHRLLEYSGDDENFARNEENPLEADCVIVDEMSMVDLMLMRSLLRAVEPGSRLLLVGDSDQLPSVGSGNVLADILESGVIPRIELTDIYRQSDTSRIVVNAHRINHGEMPLVNEPGTDFFLERRDTLHPAAESIVQLVTRRLPGFLKYPEKERLKRAMRSIQVLAASRKGECGVNNLNILLQDALNPASPGKPSIQQGETVFRLGDKVIQTKNDYEIQWRRETRAGWEEGKGVFNGDVGFITAVDDEEHTLEVLFDEDKEVTYGARELEDLELAYCLSVHKSQGSEFPAVVMPVIGIPNLLATRNLFYTALTRAKSLVVLVGQEGVIRQMVENNRVNRRYTTLKERLRSADALIREEEESPLTR